MPAPVSQTIPFTIKNVFDNTKIYGYRIRMKLLCTHSDINNIAFVVGSTTILTAYVSQNQWYGVDERVTVNASTSRDLILRPTIVTTTSSPYTINTYIKDMRVEKIQKAEIQDSEINWAGRRTSYYEGTKMTSTDINVDSADTVDGGPVITVNTVNSDTPSSNPIGTSVIITGTNNTNTSQ